jgi:hypothetical protein
MKSDCDGLAELRARLLELKRQNLRLKRLGLIGLIGVAMLIVLGQTPSKKIVEANEFILKDNSGKVRARTTMNSLGDPEMILFNEKGKEPVKLTGSIGGSPSNLGGIVFVFDGQGQERAVLSATDSWFSFRIHCGFPVGC